MKNIQPLASRGKNLIEKNLTPGEQILMQLNGAFGQALVLTDKRLCILKWGFMTGHTFGGSCISFKYQNITAVKHTQNFGTGVFEIVSAGTQNASKEYFKFNSKDNAYKADDTIVFRRQNFEAFQKAAQLTDELIDKAHTRT